MALMKLPFSLLLIDDVNILSCSIIDSVASATFSFFEIALRIGRRFSEPYLRSTTHVFARLEEQIQFDKYRLTTCRYLIDYIQHFLLRSIYIGRLVYGFPVLGHAKSNYTFRDSELLTFLEYPAQRNPALFHPIFANGLELP